MTVAVAPTERRPLVAAQRAAGRSATVPFVPWGRVQARLERDWRPGMHVSAIGPNGCGKTHLLITIAELGRDRFVLVLAAKRRDPLLESLIGAGYVPISSPKEIAWTEDGPVDQRYLYWPKASDKADARERLAFQSPKMAEALDFVDKTESWTVVIDELHWFSQNLKLERELSSAYFQGRTQGVSILGAAQRPTHVPLYAFSQASYLFLWQTSDERDVDRLAEISAGFPRRLIERAVVGLDWSSHECLFIDTRRRQLARTIAPARGTGSPSTKAHNPREKRRG